ncbi:hypothetical protein ACFWWT_36560 [Streptomyces sp. NPDC058676]|uniref:hypothetical protein n=1 Tax=unclassified Streptomyces TaxID=2593676 RepID=UPI0036663404
MSRLVVASQEPSGAIATDPTQLLWPVRIVRHLRRIDLQPGPAEQLRDVAQSVRQTEDLTVHTHPSATRR